MPLKGASGEADATPIQRAFGALTDALDQLVTGLDDGGLEHPDDAALLAFLQSFERVRNRLSVVDHRAIADGERRGLAAGVGQPSMRQVLVQLLRVSPGEAARRVAAAPACSPRISAQGQVLDAARPHLAAAQRGGDVSAEQVHIISAALTKVDRPGIDPADVDAGERLLCDFAVTFGAKDLRQLAERTVDAIAPDGTLPDEQLSLDRRHFTLRPCRDGMYAGEFRLTGAAGAKLTALLQPLAQPRIDALPTAEGRVAREADERTYGQRVHDALDEVCDRVLAAGSVVGVGGTPATVVVTVALEDLTARLGYATTTDGALIGVPEVLRLARQAEIIPAVMDSAGAVLHLGRTRRIASAAQTQALIARDGGCSFPACDRPPEWCERHHIVGWIDGGATDLDNLTLLCRHHHHNFAQRGWTCRVDADGLPRWHPPRWLDRQQKPLVNSRVRAQLANLHQRRKRRRPPAAESPPASAPSAAPDRQRVRAAAGR